MLKNWKQFWGISVEFILKSFKSNYGNQKANIMSVWSKMLNEVAMLNLALSEYIISVCHISSFVIKLFVLSQISPIYAAMFFPF